MHGIGWAVTQLRYGRKVRRARWGPGCRAVRMSPPRSAAEVPGLYLEDKQGGNRQWWEPHYDDVLARDWIIDEE